MHDLISDKVLSEVNDKIERIKQRTQRQASVFKSLQEEVQQINFDHIFKDARLLKHIRKIMTGKASPHKTATLKIPEKSDHNNTKMCSRRNSTDSPSESSVNVSISSKYIIN